MIDSAEFFDSLETMSAEDREKYFRRKLSSTVRYAYDHSPAARRTLDAVGVSPKQIRDVKDLEKLPVVRKTDIIDWQKKFPPYGGLFTPPPDEAERIFISPGPIYEPHQVSRVKWFAKAMWAAGFRQGDIVSNTFTYHMSPAGILMHEALRYCGASVVPSGTGNTDTQVQTMLDLKVTGFVGTPSFLMAVIKRAEELGRNFRKDTALKRAWFTGEMLSASLRKTFEDDYGLATFQSYAVTEPGGAIAYECREKGGMHFMDEYLIEIIDPLTGRQLGPGEVGEVVVTPLLNKVWGLLRFGTGDLSNYTSGTCACGRTSSKLTAILSRTGDAVKVRGMFVVLLQVERVMARFDQVARFQMVVTRSGERDELTLKGEVVPNLSQETRAKLADEINRRFQEVCRTRIDGIEFLDIDTLPAQYQKLIDQRVWK